MLSNRKLWSAVLGLAAATLLASSPARAVEPDKLVPADADAVVVFNVRQALDSPLVKTYALDMIKQQMKGNDQIDKIMEAAGVDPLKDIDSVLFANSGAPPKNEWLIVAHGKFNPEKFHPAAEGYAKKNPKEMKYTGEGKDRVYEVINNGSTVYAALADGSTLAMASSKEFLQATLKKGPGKLNKDMQAALDKVKGGQESMWMALVITDDLRKSLASNPQTKDLAEKLDSVTGNLNVGSDIQLSVLIHTTDADAAQKVAKQINGLKPLLGLLANGNEQAKPFIDLLSEHLQVKSKEKAATIDLKLTEVQLKKAITPEKDK